LPVISASPTSITIDEGQVLTGINVTTRNGGNADLGYTAILLNKDAGVIQGNPGVPGNVSPIINVSSYNTNQSQTVVGRSQFTFRSTSFLADRASLSTRMIIIGNETGGRVEVDIVVNPVNDIQVSATV
jgi:hypothetical protein